MKNSRKRPSMKKWKSWIRMRLGDLVELLTGRDIIGNKWVFKKNMNVEGKVEIYKARLVAKCYSRVEGIDFGEFFSLFAKLISIIFLLFVTIAFYFKSEQMDVKTTFLHWDME
jgi:hypothetical protein